MGTQRHLIWDWNGTLLDDLPLVVNATNVALGTVAEVTITIDEHRRGFRRPIADYYAEVLGRPVEAAEFGLLNDAFHAAYVAGLPCQLAADAAIALQAWAGSQSLLSMWFHDELVPAVDGHGLTSYFLRVDGLPREAGVLAHKQPHLAQHLAGLGVAGSDVVMIGDTVDDAHAAAAVGAACVLYTGGFTAAEQLRATGVPVVDSLYDAVAYAHANL